MTTKNATGRVLFYCEEAGYREGYGSNDRSLPDHHGRMCGKSYRTLDDARKDLESMTSARVMAPGYAKVKVIQVSADAIRRAWEKRANDRWNVHDNETLSRRDRAVTKAKLDGVYIDTESIQDDSTAGNPRVMSGFEGESVVVGRIKDFLIREEFLQA